MPENKIVSTHPDRPIVKDEDLHEELLIDLSSERHQVFYWRDTLFNQQIERGPSVDCKRTIDKQMLDGFFHLAVTENTIVAFQLHVSSSECSSGVEPVL